jgi:hypothetical protein
LTKPPRFFTIDAFTAKGNVMRPFFLIATTTVLFATALHAAEFSARYAPLGTGTFQINGTDQSVMSYLDTEKDRASVKLRVFSDTPSYNLQFRSVGDDGAPALPGLQVDFQISGGAPSGVNISVIDQPGWEVLLAGPDGGPVSLTDLIVDGTTVSGNFTGTLHRVDMRTSERVNETEVLEVTGTFSTEVPGE